MDKIADPLLKSSNEKQRITFKRRKICPKRKCSKLRYGTSKIWKCRTAGYLLQVLNCNSIQNDDFCNFLKTFYLLNYNHIYLARGSINQEMRKVDLQHKIRQLLQLCQFTIHSQDFKTPKPSTRKMTIVTYCTQGFRSVLVLLIRIQHFKMNTDQGLIFTRCKFLKLCPCLIFV